MPGRRKKLLICGIYLLFSAMSAFWGHGVNYLPSVSIAGEGTYFPILFLLSIACLSFGIFVISVLNLKTKGVLLISAIFILANGMALLWAFALFSVTIFGFV